jgi:hypothetical protein
MAGGTLQKSSKSSTRKTLLVWVIVALIIVVAIAVVYTTAQSFLTGATSAATGNVNSASAPAPGMLRVEEALLVSGGPGPCAPPSSCGQGSFTFIIRNTEATSVSGLKVELGNATMQSNSSLAPGQVYAGSMPAAAYPACSYQPLTISGTLSNQTSMVLDDKVLALGENGTGSCGGDEPVALSSDQVVVPVNATGLSVWPGNLVWSVEAKDATTQKVTAGYATLLMTGPTSSNGTGYQSVAMGIGSVSPGESESGTTSAFVNSKCCTEATFHVELSNGTTIDFSTTPQLIQQSYYKTFIVGEPGAGGLLIQYTFPNSTASLNMTSLLTVTNLSSPSTGTGGIYVTTTTPSGSTAAGARGPSVPVNMTIGDTSNAAPGVYLITYPQDLCPGIIFVVGVPPSSLPSIPSPSNCLDPAGVPGSQQPKAVLGFITLYLPEEVTGTQPSG